MLTHRFPLNTTHTTNYTTSNAYRYVGESEAALQRAFTAAAAKAPCLIVLDEIDALCPKRDAAGGAAERRIAATLLALLDGAQAASGVAVIGCTNRYAAYVNFKL
jgi:SpoVK/Ycf46/Vps4 family AAA+-type ATPase